MLSYPVRIALIAALGGFLFGFETVVISGAEQTLEHLWQLSKFTQGFTVSSSLIGTILGSFFAGIPAKRYGRKKVLQVIAIMFIVAALGCAFVSAWGLFIIYRIIGGLAVGASSVIAPMYISEISPAPLRGRLAGSFQVNIVAGIVVAYLTNYFFTSLQLVDSWRWMLGVMVVPSVIFAILLAAIPESPRWLILNNQEAVALRIFELAGFNKTQSFSQPIFIGVANLIFTLLAMTVIDKFGRKTLLIIGSFGMILFLGLTAWAFSGDLSGNSHLLLYLIGFIAFFAFSQGAVIWVFISEIFPNSVRSQGGSLGSSTHWIMAWIITTVFPGIVEGSKSGGYYSFVFFAIMMVLQLIFIWRVMPETKGRTLEEIQKELGIS
jgi:MFS family permease